MKYEKYITTNDDGTYSIPFTSKVYSSKKAANAAASFYITQPDSYIKRRALSKNIGNILNIRITYDQIYAGGDSAGFINWTETIDYNSDTAGGGFYRAFDSIWDDLSNGNMARNSVYRTLGYLYYHSRDDVGIRALIDEIGQNIPDSAYDFAIQILDNMDSDELDALLDVYHDSNADEFRGDATDSDFSIFD